MSQPVPKPYLVGICGGSASGKTYLLNQLLQALPASQVTLISQDNYYFDLDHQIRDEEGLVNFDHPQSVDLVKLYEDVQKLMQGESVEIAEYTFNNPGKESCTIVMEPRPIILLEGIFVFYLAEMRELYDLKVFVEAKEHVKLSRRLNRDIAERGLNMESILRDYGKFVAPMYNRYVVPTKDLADIIVPNNDNKRMDAAISVLVNHMNTVLEKDLG
ncbi:uridine kinase [Pontibacter sp. G13]|uniref:uridine kinase n=1 Tax=Pontibacter sp. G13 TaxID=3074898 RepID=UPI0028890CF4|nr:uridine kinase [Pontibacter sp. G13]WNJ16938.1 uridine kinase [Pontibacter sp. G13]